jgi:hypothetical protein
MFFSFQSSFTSKSKLVHTAQTQYNQRFGHVSPPDKNNKTESPVHFGNPAVFESYLVFSAAFWLPVRFKFIHWTKAP